MKLGTANIKNYPDMPRAKVVEDARTMSKICDVWGQQENDPKEDDDAIDRALGPDWFATHRRTNIPIWYRQSILKVTSTKIQFIPLEPDLPLVPKPRDITATNFKVRAEPLIPAFTVINCHFIAGGMHGPEEPARRRQWLIEWEYLNNFIRHFRKQDKTVFVIGDFNHSDPPKPWLQFKWIGGKGLDRIGHTTRGTVYVKKNGGGSVELNSDHDGQWVRVGLTSHVVRREQ